MNRLAVGWSARAQGLVRAVGGICFARFDQKHWPIVQPLVTEFYCGQERQTTWKAGNSRS